MQEELKHTVSLPQEVTIGAFRYAVTYPDTIVDEEDNEMSGFLSTSNEVMEIWSGLTARGRFETIVHEAFHAISDQIPYPLALSEEQIQAISPYMTALMYQLGHFEPTPLYVLQETRRQEIHAAQRAARILLRERDAEQLPDKD